VLKCEENLNHSLVLKILTMFRHNLTIVLRGTVNRSPDNRGSTVFIYDIDIRDSNNIMSSSEINFEILLGSVLK
jgi:hypothetical protein